MLIVTQGSVNGWRELKNTTYLRLVCTCACLLAIILWWSLIRVNIVASVPGGHCGRDMLKWGHMKLRKVDCELTNTLAMLFLSQLLSQHGPSSAMVSSGWPVIGQFSSIGSLGPTSSHWLTSEWLTSLSTTRSAGITAAKTAKLNLVCHTLVSK